MAITLNYVDYGAGNDTTGDGTIGTPWKTLQKAFDTVVRNTTDGNQICLKAGTAHVNAAALDLATFIGGGALGQNAPLIMRGYTSAANDGGKGEIDCNGATMFAAATYDWLMLVDLTIHNFGNNHGIVLDDFCMLYRCEVHKGASLPSSKYLVTLGDYNVALRCYIHDPHTVGICIYFNNVGTVVRQNHIDTTTGNSAAGISVGNAYGSVICQNVIRSNHTDAVGIIVAASSGWLHIFDNDVFNAAAGTARGIYAGNFAGRVVGIVENNIIEGWSGAGGDAIEALGDVYLLGSNAFYNNTNANTLSGMKFIDDTALDHALAASAWVNAGSGDFDINGTVTGVTEDAAGAFHTLSSTSQKADKGAVQAGAGAGSSGGGFPILGGSVVR